MADENTDVAAAKRAADLAKARLDEFKAQSDLAMLRLTGSLATPPAVTALSGETKLTDVTIESRILAQKAIATICGEIARLVAEAVKDDKGSIVLYDANALSNVYQYRAAIKEIDSLIAAYGRLPQTQASREMASLMTVTGAISAAAGLISLFRTNTEIVGKTFNLAEAVLMASLARALRLALQERVVVYPTLNAPPSNANDSALLTKLDDLLKLRHKPAAPGQLERAALDERVDRLAASLTASDDPFKTPLSAMIKAERLAGFLTTGHPHILAASLHDVAGTSKTTRNLFTGTKLFFSGGAVVTYFLLAADGSIASSDTLYHWTGFQEMTQAFATFMSNLGSPDGRGPGSA